MRSLGVLLFILITAVTAQGEDILYDSLVF